MLTLRMVDSSTPSPASPAFHPTISQETTPPTSTSPITTTSTIPSAPIPKPSFSIRQRGRRSKYPRSQPLREFLTNSLFQKFELDYQNRQDEDENLRTRDNRGSRTQADAKVYVTGYIKQRQKRDCSCRTRRPAPVMSLTRAFTPTGPKSVASSAAASPAMSESRLSPHAKEFQSRVGFPSPIAPLTSSPLCLPPLTATATSPVPSSRMNMWALERKDNFDAALYDDVLPYYLTEFVDFMAVDMEIESEDEEEGGASLDYGLGLEFADGGDVGLDEEDMVEVDLEANGEANVEADVEADIEAEDKANDEVNELFGSVDDDNESGCHSFIAASIAEEVNIADLDPNIRLTRFADLLRSTYSQRSVDITMDEYRILGHLGEELQDYHRPVPYQFDPYTNPYTCENSPFFLTPAGPPSELSKLVAESEPMTWEECASKPNGWGGVIGEGYQRGKSQRRVMSRGRIPKVIYSPRTRQAGTNFDGDMHRGKMGHFSIMEDPNAWMTNI